MGPLKAPGKDGFPAAFYQKFWGTIGKDVTKVFLEVLNKGRRMDDLNSKVIKLVQKPISMVDYRSISLCNVLYKVIAKAMTNRLRGVLGWIISEAQCAFIPGHNIGFE
ncbi:hypothetical protein Ddye_024377 [Dipteronia dyeriana]|uniref:Reverse transcriptase domain-containing protein n=1 Tax=Dipteronia dyeriana TaxID=168575 RepID=A0AAD9WSW9_9ROSI|nr:hypothetical protein Ddye_024377 [Dipteronia dyeriana]